MEVMISGVPDTEEMQRKLEKLHDITKISGGGGISISLADAPLLNQAVLS